LPVASPPADGIKHPSPASEAAGPRATYLQAPLSFEANAGQADAEVKFLSRGPGYALFLTPAEIVLSLRGASGQSSSVERPSAGEAEEGKRGKGEKETGLAASGQRSVVGSQVSVASGQLPVASDQSNPTQHATHHPEDASRLSPLAAPLPLGTSRSVRLRLEAANPAPTLTPLDALPGAVNYFRGSDPTQWRTNVTTFAKVRYEQVYPGINLIFYGNQRQLEFDFVVAPGADPRQIALTFEGAEKLELDDNGDLVLHVGDAEIRQHKPHVYQLINGEKRDIAGGYVIGKDSDGIDGIYRIEEEADDATADVAALWRAPQHSQAERTLWPSSDQSSTMSKRFEGGGARQSAATPVTFALADYDPTQPLVIDPVLSYSTYLGGTGDDYAFGIAVDLAGNAYVVGQTISTDFPTVSPVQSSHGNGNSDAFVTKFSPSGDLVYSTYLGGDCHEYAYAVALDSDGNAYVTGTTCSQQNTFPLVNPLQPGSAGDWDGFVCKLNATGTALVYSTFLGGTLRDNPWGIAVDSSGNAYVVGGTTSANFPTLAPLQPGFGGKSYYNFGDAFITKINAAGSALVYSTFLGGLADDEASAVAVDADGNAYVTGSTFSDNFPTANPFQPKRAGESDAFVSKLNFTGSALVFSTYLGGFARDGSRSGVTYGYGDPWNYGGNQIAVDRQGKAYVVGVTLSGDFPLRNPSVPRHPCPSTWSPFVAAFQPTGHELVYSTFLSGCHTFGFGIAVDGAGYAYVTGGGNPIPSVNGFGADTGDWATFIAKLGNDGPQVIYASSLGGSRHDRFHSIGVDANGNAYVAGWSNSGGNPNDFPTKNAVQPEFKGPSTDAIVAKIGADPDTTPPSVALITTRGNPRGVYIEFTEPVDPVTATIPANYTVEGGPAVTEAILIFNSRTVRLTLASPLTVVATHAVMINNVQDRALPTHNTIAANTRVEFFNGREVYSGAKTGSVLVREYHNIGGNSLNDLYNSGKFPHAPDLETVANSFEWPAGVSGGLPPSNVRDNYGTQILGLLYPPVTGNYVFYMSSDDNGALWLSTDNSPVNKVQIATESQWGSIRAWVAPDRRTFVDAGTPDRRLENRSKPILLQAGKGYYIEAHSKEGGGGDNLAVTWQLPGAPEPVNGAPPIPGEFLSTPGTLIGGGLWDASVAILAHPASQSVTELQPASFTVSAEGSVPLAFQWFRNGVAITGATSATYHLAGAALNDNGAIYTVQVSNDFSSATSNPAVLTVRPDTTAPTVASVIGFGDQVTITFSESVAESTALDPANYSIEGLQIGPAPPPGTPSLAVTRGLRLWLRADNGVTLNENGKVISWDDASGNLNHASQGSEHLAPTHSENTLNGKPAVHFDGNDWMEVAHAPSLSLTKDIASFVVVRVDDRATGEHGIWTQYADNQVAAPNIFRIDETGYPQLVRGDGVSHSAYSAAVPMTPGRFALIGFTAVNQSVTYFLNGHSLGTHDFPWPVADAGGPLRIGPRSHDYGLLRGDIAELLIYEDHLDDGERNAIMNYLQAKYGLESPVAPIALSRNGKAVHLKTSPQTPGASYTVTVNGIKDTAATPNPIAANTKASFTAQTLLPGYLYREVYRPIAGDLPSLKNLSKFPDRPTTVGFVDAFESPRNIADNYGTRLSGYVTPPFDGDYAFFLGVDDFGELYLSPDGDPANKKLIAASPFGSSGVRGFDNTERGTLENPRTISHPVFLRAGHRYYVEALMSEGGGDDQISINWQFLPYGRKPYSGMAPIPGEYLAVVASPTGKSLTITQQPQGVTLQENERTTLSVQVSASSPNIIYQWQKNGGNICGANSPSYTTPFLTLGDHGTKYRCVVSILGVTVVSAEATVNVVNDTSAPTVLSATTSRTFDRVTLQFSEPVNAADALNPANYSFSGGLTLNSIQLSEDGSTVTLLTSPQASYTDYTVTLNNLHDRSPAAHVIAPNSQVTFKSWFAGLNSGGLRREVYLGIGGWDLNSLRNQPKFPGSPDIFDVVRQFEAPRDFGDNYGVRLSGFVVPPATGDYVFYLASDQQGELYLSSDETPANKALIAQEPVWNGYREWINGAMQGSRLAIPDGVGDDLPLVAGTLFIEGEDFNFNRGNYVKDKPIGMTGPYPGGDYQNKGTATDRGIDWEANGNAGQPYRSSTDVAAGKPNQQNIGFNRGSFSVQVNHVVGWQEAGEWYNYTRVFPEPAREYDVYARLSSGGSAPRAQLDLVTGNRSQPNQTLQELGEFDAPSTGNWDTFHFYRLKDDARNQTTVTLGGERTIRFTILPGNLDIDYLAFVPAGNRPPPVVSRPSNISASIHLEAGRRYYVEALMKEEGGGDNLGVTWQLPGAPPPVNGDPPIPGAYLAYEAVYSPEELAFEFTQHPESVSLPENRSATFAVATTSESPDLVFQWQRDGVDIPGASGPAYTTPLLTLADDGAKYRCVATLGPVQLPSAEATVTVLADREPPVLQAAARLSASVNIGVCFNERLDPTSANNRFNYAIDSATVTKAELRPDGQTVALTVTAFPAGPVNVRVNNVKDLAGNTISAESTVAIDRLSIRSVDYGIDPNFVGAGSTVSCRDGEFVVLSRSGDMGGGGDSYRFTFETRTGDFDVKVQVARNTPSSPNTRAGLMVRESLDTDTRNYHWVGFGPGQVQNNYYELLHRPFRGVSKEWVPESEIIKPVPYPNAWLRLKRQGGTFYFYYGMDGRDWIEATRHTPTTPYPNSVYLGLAVSEGSHTPDREADVQFLHYGDYDPGAPTIVQAPVAATTIENLNATFEVLAKGTAPFRYQWKLNGVELVDGPNVSGARLRTLTIRKAQLSQAGSYTVTVSNVDGSVTSAAATLTVIDPPEITTPPQSQVVIQGADVVFGVEASGTEPLTYQWRFNGAELAGETTPFLFLPSVTASRAGKYSVLVSNAGGAALSLEAALTVIVPPTITTPPANRTVIAGQSATFNVSVSGSAPFEYQWFKGGVVVPGATGASLTLNNAQPSDEGVYTVQVSNLAGEALSPGATLTVLVPPVITTPPVGATVAVGSTVTLSVSATGTPPLSYQWRKGGVDLAGKTAATLELVNVQTSDTGDYSVVVSNAAGNAPSAAVRVQVNIPPSITTQPRSQTVNVGANVTLFVGATGTPPLSYQWFKGGVALEGKTSASLSLPNIQASDAGDYTVKVSNSVGEVTSAVATVAITVAPTIKTPPADQTVVLGREARFTVEVEGTAPFTYQWLFNGAPISGATSEALVLASVKESDAGGYSVRVSNGAGSVTSAAATLTVLVPPTITVPPQSAEVRTGQNVTFTVAATGSGPLSYQWRFNGVEVGGATGTSHTIASVRFEDAGTYTVRVSNAAGEALSSDAVLVVRAPNVAPSVAITSPANLESFTAPANVAFKADASDTDGSVARVEFLADGAVVATDPSAPYETTLTALALGTYTLRARATDNEGLSATSAAVTLIVRPANNEFEAAAVLSGEHALAEGSNVNATKQSGEPGHGGNAGGKSVWWRWTAPRAGSVVVNTHGSGFDTVLGVYTGAAVNALTLVASGDDTGDDVTSGASFAASAGATYWIAVDGWGGASGGVKLELIFNSPPTVRLTGPAEGAVFTAPATIGLSAEASDEGGRVAKVEFFQRGQKLGEDATSPFGFTWSGVEPGNYVLSAKVTDDLGATAVSSAVNVRVKAPPPANDHFLNRILLSGSSASATGTNVEATREAGEPAHAPNAGGQSVWWSWPAPAGGRVTISTTGSGVDTLLAVYTGFSLGGLTLVASDDDSGGNGTSRLSFESLADTVYQIAVDSLVGVAGELKLSIELVVPPTVTLSSPVNGATFNAPATVVLTGKASKAGGTIARVELYQGATLLGTVTELVATQFTLTWLNVVAGNYTLTAKAIDTDGHAATSEPVSIVVQGVAAVPVIVTGPASQTVASGSAVSLSVAAEGTPPLAYQWKFNGAELADGAGVSGATGATLQLANVQSARAGSYTVSVSNEAGSVTSAPASLTVIEPPRITLQSASQTVVAGATVTLSVAATGTGPLSYQWHFNGEPLAGATDTALELANVQPDQSGSYTVAVRNAAGALLSSEVLLTVVPQAAAGEPPTLARENFWITDGPVHAVAQAHGVVYLGGEFDYVGPNLGAGAALDVESGAPDRAWPKVNGEVRAVVSDGAGGWFVGGIFTSVGGVTRNNLAHLRSDKTVDAAWNPNANGPVRALALAGSTLYVGGQFTRIANQNRLNLAALEAATGEATAWAPEADGPVHALVLANGVAYVGGEFSFVHGQSRKRIAALNLTDGAATAWNPNANDFVFALAVTGNTVYAGGQFSNIGGQARSRIAALDATTGDALAWAPEADNSVRALAVGGGVVYAGGFFTSIGGQSRTFVAALDAASGAATAWDAAADNAVLALAAVGEVVYAGGQFSAIGGAARMNLGALDAASGAARAWAPQPNDRVFALAPAGSVLYAGGRFLSAGGRVRNALAALDVASGVATDWDPNADGPVRALVLAEDAVFVGGFFNSVGGVERNFLAALELASGAPTAWDANANDFVYALALSGDVLYASGEFTQVGEQPRNRIAALDLATGAPTTWDANANAAVFALAAAENVVYAGGDFTSIGGATRTRVAALNPASGGATGWNPIADGRVTSLLVADNTVYAGGFFGTISGRPRSRLAALNATTGDATAWDPAATKSGASSFVNALALSGNTVFAGGAFGRLGAQTRNHAGGVDVIVGAATAWNPNLNGAVLALALEGNTAFVGGEFTTVSGQVLPFFAAFAAEGLPILIAQPVRQTVAAGSGATFTVIARGQEPLRYQWRFNGSNLADDAVVRGSTTATLELRDAQPGHAGDYSVVVSNDIGAATSESAALVVLTPPAIASQPLDQDVAPGTRVTFAVTATGSEPLFFQWRRNGENLPGATGATYVIADAQPTDAGTYSVAVANSVASVNSREAVLKVAVPGALALADNFAERVTTEEASGSVAGSNVAATRESREPLHAGKVGGKSLWWGWRAPANGIASFNTLGSTFDTLLAIYTGTSVSDLTEVAADEDSGGFFASAVTFNAVAGTEYAIAIDGFGGVSGNAALNWSFEATEAEVPRLLVPPQSQTAPLGSKVTLEVVAASTLPLSYRWYFNGVSIGGATSATYTINSMQPANVGLYTVEVSNGSRSILSPPAVLEIGEQIQARSEDKLQDLTAAGGSGPSPLGTGRGRKTNFAAPVVGLPGTQVLDNFDATKELNEPNHAGQVGGASRIFRLKIESSGLLVLDTLGSDVDTVMAVYQGNSWANINLIASDDNGAADGLRSQVRFPVVKGDEYLVAIDGVRGATGNIKLNWLLGTQPALTKAPASQTVEQGADVVLIAAATATPAPSYQWRRNGLELAGATEPTLTLRNVQSSDAGDYTVVVRNAVGATTSAAAKLTVSANRPPVLTPVPNQTVDEGQLLAFTLNATDPDGVANTLTFALEPGAPVGVSLDATSGKFTWTPTEAQGPSTHSIAVRVTDNGAPPLSDTKSFTLTVREVNAPPVLGAIGNKAGKEGELVSFTLSASDPADLPPNLLTFSASGLPAGADLNAVTGLFTWTPALSQNGDHTITFIVTDDGTPPLTDTETITVSIEGTASLVLGGVEIRGGAIHFTWPVQSGRRYRVQFKPSLDDANWTDLPEPATPGEFSDTLTGGQRFYRVRRVD
jgi:hypothetical protein